MHISPFTLFHFTQDFLCSGMLKAFILLSDMRKRDLNHNDALLFLIHRNYGLLMLAQRGCRFTGWHVIIIWKITILLFLVHQFWPWENKSAIQCAFLEMPLSLHTTILPGEENSCSFACVALLILKSHLSFTFQELAVISKHKALSFLQPLPLQQQGVCPF